jgi:predicted alpha/beta hydrolase family esterase
VAIRIWRSYGTKFFGILDSMQPGEDRKLCEDHMTNPVLIVPGLGGSGLDHWQTHLERALPGLARVQQDDWDRPDAVRWIDRLVRAVEAHPGAVLVAHSLGCPLVAHVAARRPDLPIVAALLVAPADVDSAHHTPSHTRGFAPIPRRPLPFRAILVASSNDPFMEFDRARELAADWNAEFIDAGASGHINVASGFGRWREGERILTSMIASISGARSFTRIPQPAGAAA